MTVQQKKERQTSHPHSRSEPAAESPTRLQALENENRLLKRKYRSLEKKLFKAHRFLDDLSDVSSGISIIETDLDRTILSWNSGAKNLFGYPANQAIGQKIDILYPQDTSTRKTLDQIKSSILEKGFGTSCDICEKRRDGQKVWIRLTVTPRRNQKGEIVGMLGIGQDISEHKQTEKILHHSLKRLRRAVGGTVHAIALTVEKRDPYTAGHQQRATDIARMIATEMKLSRNRIDAIRMAGVIHDLGKLYVPAEILNKPGALSSQEFMLIKTHPEAGYDILKYIDFPWPIGDIVLQHHERIDGSGYPRGLCGKEISLEARIIAVADVVESMSSHRPYRPALGLKRALEEVRTNRGTSYDPQVVDCCLDLFSRKKNPLHSLFSENA